MANGQEYTKGQEKIIGRYYDNRDSIMSNKLGEIVSELYLCEESKKREKLWESARIALVNAGVNSPRIATIISEKNVESLGKLVNEIAMGTSKEITRPGAKASEEGKTPAPAAAATPTAPAAPTRPPATGAVPLGMTPRTTPLAAFYTPEDLKMAMKAFKKRLKLARLDEESKLGRSPMSNGANRVVAIMPPSQFPRGVWEELVKQGRLKKSGRDMYEMGVESSGE